MLNEFGQAVGASLVDWSEPSLPPRAVLSGTYCQVEPLNPAKHARALSEICVSDTQARDWTYMAFGPFSTASEVHEWVEDYSQRAHSPYYAIVDSKSRLPTGVVCYLRMDPSHGSIEIGGIVYSDQLKRTAAATEAIFLLAQNVFDLGYRRCEWKCDSLNEASRRAALRLGFSFEGIFRQAVIYKGRNRDTAWYSIIDRDWPDLRRAYLRWFAPDNFDSAGRQKTRLSDLTQPLLRRVVEEASE